VEKIMMKKVYIEYGSQSYASLFAGMGFGIVHAPEAADFVCFTGGSDVTPYLYGDQKHRTTHNSFDRDERERKLFDYLLEKKVPMVGICRGAQFLNVMSGGRMYQDVSSHGRSHTIVDRRTGETVYVTSTHHQMMLPQGKYELIASSNLKGSREWFDQEVAKRDISEEDIEVVHYPLTNCLCFQPHPELYQEYAEYSGMRQYFNGLINEFVLEKKDEYIPVV
jgi:anthranilate/para-aminobenzoate synthase component II